MRTTETARCPVCRGVGFKGNGFWNILTDCVACRGTGKVEVHRRRPERHVELDWHREMTERVAR